tara:strand:+ start:357 stop:539 length:183 start_codon:yes stop_codon:yes gene_type:complete
MDIKRDEVFHFVRWLNLLIGTFNLYLWTIGGGHHLIALSVLNMAVWAFTRKSKKKANSND